MPINIFRFFLDVLVEAYAVSILLFWLVSLFELRLKVSREGFWNFLNLLGFGLGLLLLIDEVTFFVVEPRNNYVAHWKDQPYWHEFHVVIMMVFLLSVILMCSKKRRTNQPWNILGAVLLLSPSILKPVEQWLTGLYYGRAYPISVSLSLFSAQTWWLVLGMAACLLGMAFLFSPNSKEAPMEAS